MFCRTAMLAALLDSKAYVVRGWLIDAEVIGSAPAGRDIQGESYVLNSLTVR